MRLNKIKEAIEKLYERGYLISHTCDVNHQLEALSVFKIGDIEIHVDRLRGGYRTTVKVMGLTLDGVGYDSLGEEIERLYIQQEGRVLKEKITYVDNYLDRIIQN